MAERQLGTEVDIDPSKFQHAARSDQPSPWGPKRQLGTVEAVCGYFMETGSGEGKPPCPVCEGVRPSSPV